MVTWKQINVYKNMLVQFENNHVYTWNLHEFVRKYYTLVTCTLSYPDDNIKYYEEHANDTHVQYAIYYDNHLSYLRHIKKMGVYLGLRTEKGNKTKLAIDLENASNSKNNSIITEERRRGYFKTHRGR